MVPYTRVLYDEMRMVAPVLQVEGRVSWVEGRA